MEWRHQAKCHGLWHIFDGVEDEYGEQHYPLLEEARAICHTCPVFDQCREDSKKARVGIWAGEIRK